MERQVINVLFIFFIYWNYGEVIFPTGSNSQKTIKDDHW